MARDASALLGQDFLVRGPLLAEPPLEGPGAQVERPCDRRDVGPPAMERRVIAVGTTSVRVLESVTDSAPACRSALAASCTSTSAATSGALSVNGSPAATSTRSPVRDEMDVTELFRVAVEIGRGSGVLTRKNLMGREV